MHQSRFVLSLVSVLLIGAGMACAGELPAVSGINGKISAEGGTYDDQGAGIAVGSLALPLGHSFGLQADGALGTIDGEIMGGGGLHLFTRDPSRYLLGVFGSYHTWDSIDIWRLAGEAELYFGRFTLTGLAGYESVDVPTLSDGLEVLTTDDKHFFGQGDLAYYINDDFKVYGGYRYINETSFGSAGAEYLIRGTQVPLSLFARANFGQDEYTSITGGLKVYLGADPQKSLIERNRQDDPEIYVPVFPKLATRAQGLPTCTMSSHRVSSPANGQCLCPAGEPMAGRQPYSSNGRYYCAS